MSSTEYDILGKLIDWHNETDTVVRVDIYDPFIIEILQNQKLRKEVEHDIEETSNHPKSPPDKLLFDYLTDLLEDSKK